MIPDFKKKEMKYKPEYCDDLLKYMGQGYSNLELAAKFGIAEKTFYAWLSTHSEFQEAFDIGDPKRFAYMMAKADKSFLEDKNDKGYKHWQKKMSYMYRNYSPEATTTSNSIQIGSVNILEGKSQESLAEILMNKLKKNENRLIEAKVIEVQALPTIDIGLESTNE